MWWQGVAAIGIWVAVLLAPIPLAAFAKRVEAEWDSMAAEEMQRRKRGGGNV